MNSIIKSIALSVVLVVTLAIALVFGDATVALNIVSIVNKIQSFGDFEITMMVVSIAYSIFHVYATIEETQFAK